MRNTIYMKYPAAWHGDMWREGAPCGSGAVGALVYGSVKSEIITLTNAFLWHNGHCQSEIPDISDKIPELRQLLDENNTAKAEHLLTGTLSERGYQGGYDLPIPLCDIRIEMESRLPIKNYIREIDMETATVSVNWQSGGKSFSRKTFVSRENDVVYTLITADAFCIYLDCHDRETLHGFKVENPEQGISVDGDLLYFTAKNNTGKNYGACGRIVTDGEVEYKNGKAYIKNAKKTVFSTKTFVESEKEKEILSAKEFLTNETLDFDLQSDKHIKLHKKLFSEVTFSLSPSDYKKSNEQLLLDAYDGQCSDELIEKLWSYGRYLFICATREDAPPCHLTGLWNASYTSFWAINMFNVNFEMIYWQALQNNLPQMLLAAFDYIEKYMDDFRENAKKVFGCRGININSVNTPVSALHRCIIPHIIHWTGASAWISQHYYDYYLYTKDEEFLRQRAIPFMYETALFYEDFIIYDENGYAKFSPSNSPENTPKSILISQKHENETTMNATMDKSLVFELLTNLIAGCKATGLYTEKIETWENILKKLPPYQINENGGIKEWLHDFYDDNENHRHHSHIYALFPGVEITPNHPLFENFKRANELRFEIGLNEHSSWGMMYAACADARCGNGEKAVECIDIVAQTCIMNNFFTVHNDWRRQGPIMCEDMRAAPFQIDANMGITSAVNEMLLTSRENEMVLLPAIPKRWKIGNVTNLSAKNRMSVTIEWKNNVAKATVKAEIPVNITIIYGKISQNVSFERNETKYFEWKLN